MVKNVVNTRRVEAIRRVDLVFCEERDMYLVMEQDVEGGV